VNANPYKPPTTPPERPAAWPRLAVGIIAGGLLGSTSGTLCALALTVIHLAIELPGSLQAELAVTLVLRGGQSAIVGSLAGLLWGTMLGVIGVVLSVRAPSGPEFKRTFVLLSSIGSGFFGGAAGMYFNWFSSSGSRTLWIAVGSALGVVSAVWASRRFTRVLGP
jgi:hypothetical protein